MHILCDTHTLTRSTMSTHNTQKYIRKYTHTHAHIRTHTHTCYTHKTRDLLHRSGTNIIFAHRALWLKRFVTEGAHRAVPGLRGDHVRKSGCLSLPPSFDSLRGTSSEPFPPARTLRATRRICWSHRVLSPSFPLRRDDSIEDSSRRTFI